MLRHTGHICLLALLLITAGSCREKVFEHREPCLASVVIVSIDTEQSTVKEDYYHVLSYVGGVLANDVVTPPYTLRKGVQFEMEKGSDVTFLVIGSWPTDGPWWNEDGFVVPDGSACPTVYGGSYSFTVSKESYQKVRVDIKRLYTPVRFDFPGGRPSDGVGVYCSAHGLTRPGLDVLEMEEASYSCTAGNDGCATLPLLNEGTRVGVRYGEDDVDISTILRDNGYDYAKCPEIKASLKGKDGRILELILGFENKSIRII